MGVAISYIGGFWSSNEPDPVTGLTPKEKALVGNSWNIVKKNILENGIQLFLIYFKDYPQYQSYFPFKDVPYEELSTNKKLKGHATNVMYAITAIIDNISNNDVLVDLLEKNGISHAKRKIPEQAYWDLKICVLKLLQAGLGSKCTTELKDAWDKTLTVAFTVVINTLKENDL